MIMLFVKCREQIKTWLKVCWLTCNCSHCCLVILSLGKVNKCSFTAKNQTVRHIDLCTNVLTSASHEQSDGS